MTNDGSYDSDQRSPQRRLRAAGDGAAWVNVELTKNAAGIGYARFLYAVRR